jgi:hypothetical protein
LIRIGRFPFILAGNKTLSQEKPYAISSISSLAPLWWQRRRRRRPRRRSRRQLPLSLSFYSSLPVLSFLHTSPHFLSAAPNGDGARRRPLRHRRGRVHGTGAEPLAGARARPWRSASSSRALDRCLTMAEPGPLSARQQRRWLSPLAPRRWLRAGGGLTQVHPLPITAVFFFYPNRIRVRVTFSVLIRNRFISFLIQSDQLLCVSFFSELDLHTRSSLAL